ncbi:MAG TPA: hypothetical protein VL098_08400 [Flavipsychrobacter sp.]|nr:hypothetical protein [Flavipsychrobacter sp.]
MSNTFLSAEEEAVNKHLEEASIIIDHLQKQIDNLPPDGIAPQPKPAGGPSDVPSAHMKIALEKQILATKEDMIGQVGRELQDAPPDVRERCNYAVDKFLYPEQQNPADKKDIDASQAHISKAMYERKLQDAEHPLQQSDQKDKDQSAQFMYQTRYGKEPQEAQLEAKDIKTLDQSQDYAYRLRFGDDGPGDPGEGVDSGIDIDITDD